MPDVFVSKYNKFVDGIFTRINTILKKSYDPVNVQLNMEGAEIKSATGHKKSNKKWVNLFLYCKASINIFFNFKA